MARLRAPFGGDPRNTPQCATPMCEKNTPPDARHQPARYGTPSDATDAPEGTEARMSISGFATPGGCPRNIPRYVCDAEREAAEATAHLCPVIPRKPRRPRPTVPHSGPEGPGGIPRMLRRRPAAVARPRFAASIPRGERRTAAARAGTCLPRSSCFHPPCPDRSAASLS